MNDIKTEWINIAKALSILMIVIFHIIGQIFGGFNNMESWENLRIISYEGVNTFFLVSGLGISMSLLNKNNEINWLEWWKKRFIKIIPLYWFVLVLTLLAFIIGIPLMITPTNNYVMDFVLHFLLLNDLFSQTYYSINVAWWFLPMIVICYFTISLLWNKILIIDFTKHWIIILCTLILSLFALLNRETLLIKPQIIDGIVFFYFGVLISLNYKYLYIIEAKTNKLIIFLPLFIIGIISSLFFLHKSIITSILIVLFIIYISILITNIIFLKSFFIRISIISYPIYLIHWAFIKPIFSIYKRISPLNVPIYLDLMFALIMYFLVIILISYLLQKLEYIFFKSYSRYILIK